MGDAYTPVRGKCTWWREMIVDEDVHNVRLKAGERRVTCSCFVEGKVWSSVEDDVPSDCPDAKHCRYYIKCW
ncbi:MAG: hypothetical protein CVT67_04480 [Actinobacteria bacterium HGW-Actinobacteria-7]|jgi:hypothetical protein|nr:MAG: hypothetical protein CVT67_04480 [Actinobacteria bacterium HGW-Actinobacteria-7]